MAEGSGFWKVVNHPRTNLIAGLALTGVGLVSPEVAAYVLWSAAGVLVVRSAWEWEQLQNRITFKFQVPIVRKAPRPKVAPPPVQLGRVDFELYAQRASNAANRILGQMGKEMERGGNDAQKQGERLQKLGPNAPVERRHRALGESAKVLHQHAQRLARARGAISG